MTAKTYWIMTDGVVAGPYAVEQLQGMCAAGNFNENRMVCETGGQNWIPAKTALPSFFDRARVAVSSGTEFIRVIKVFCLIAAPASVTAAAYYGNQFQWSWLVFASIPMALVWLWMAAVLQALEKH